MARGFVENNIPTSNSIFLAGRKSQFRPISIF